MQSIYKQSCKTCDFWVLIMTFSFTSPGRNNCFRDYNRKIKVSRVFEENVCYMNWCFQSFCSSFLFFSMQTQQCFNNFIQMITNWCNFSTQYTFLCTWFLWPEVFSALARVLLSPELLTFLLLIGFRVYFPWST